MNIKIIVIDLILGFAKFSSLLIAIGEIKGWGSAERHGHGRRTVQVK